MRLILGLILLLTLGRSSTSAQIDTLDAGLVRLLEEYIEFNELDENFDFNTVFDYLAALQNNPLDINTATEQDLRNIILLNDLQVNNLLNYRASSGPLLDILELQAIPSFDINTIKTIRPFFTVGKDTQNIRQKFSDRLRSGKSALFVKWRRVLEERRGFQSRIDEDTGEVIPPNFAGSPNYWYTRYRFSAGRGLMFGLTLENDQGEPFFEGINKNTGFDYQSFFLYAEDINSRVKAAALGDYTISFGQGLIIHNGFGAGKSSLVMNLKRGGNSIRPYSSVNEFNFFRGAATTLALSDGLDLTVFGSYKPIDGTIDTSLVLEDEIFTSFTVDGLHRTESEISKKNNIRQTSAGASLVYRNQRNLKLGFNYLYNAFDKPLERNTTLNTVYRFNGTALSNLSLDYSYRFENLNFFGEVAASDNGATAQLHGLLATVDRRVDLSLLYRNYDRDYQALNPNAFGESSLPINEKGMYIGMIVRPIKKWTISAYADFFQFPWLRFRADAPYSGSEYLIRLEYYRKRRFTAYLQYRLERKAVNVNVEENRISQLASTSLHRLRLNVSNKISKSVELRNRIEYSLFSKEETSNGYLIYQDFIWKPTGSPFSCSMRYSIFDVDRFDNRIYAFENDLLYEFRIPFFVDKGQRYYINARYKVLRNLTLEFRYARTILSEAEGIVLLDNLSFSSGNNLIQGNKFTEVKAQVRYTF